MLLENLLRVGSHAFPIREYTGIRGRSRKERDLRRSQNINMLVGIGIGAAVGVTTGLLLAPHSGKETRGRIASQTHSLAGQVKKSTHQAKERLAREPWYQSAGQFMDETAESTQEAAKRAGE